MGDRAYVSLECLPKDVEFFEEEGYYCDGSNGGLEVMYAPEQDGGDVAFWGDEGPLGVTVPAEHVVGRVFYGHHGEGYDFGPGVFACDGKRYAHAVTILDHDEPVARINERGEVNPDDLRRAKWYYEVLAAAQKKLNRRAAGARVETTPK